ncbi:DUF349 domain-containing protein [Pontibacter sp. KCTC 32443]|uniref:DUF349 domain-containing protein n=1 Tax=Pontibacter TaxID=323449 RepID=UPI00164E0237|nr:MULTISPECIES: DUF349 domain-containing protein [Pontibacter]MBC5773392.1 DUF349 domain-containing protein [Pontibacter sp. KCTC 32443]
MTTENKDLDTTGAEVNKPENQNAADEQKQQPESPQSIIEKRLAEINAGKQAQHTESAEVPKEEQPEVMPNLTTPDEAAESEVRTEIMADAIADTSEPETTAAPVNTQASAEVESETASEQSQVAITEKPQGSTLVEHEYEEQEDDEDHTDYSQSSLEELRSLLANTLKRGDVRKNHKTINELQRHYDQRFQSEKTEALLRFKQEGGTEEDFEYHPTPEHQDLEKLLVAYRDARHQERQQTEEQRQRNLERKQELLSRLRELVESAETKSSSDELKKLQAEWKSIGPVPAGAAQQLWDSYHALLDIFYNNRSIFYELKELDRKRNLDAKIQLIERAEALENEQSINKALEELRHLHEEWKNIGPVPNDQRDPIWERFIQASEKVHTRRKAYQEDRKAHEMQNLEKKRALLERLQTYQGFNTDRINEWRDKTDEIQKLKEEWDAAGLVPKEYAEEINKNFWGNYKAFFQHKNQFFKGLDEQKMQNLRLKTELCEEAEVLKDSTDWNATKEKLIQLQKKWKTIGRVPDKYSDKIWQRFRSACNEFFDRKQVQEQSRTAEQEKLSSEKMALTDRISEKLSQPTAPASLEEYQQFLNQWRALDQSNQRSTPKVEEKFIALMENYLERVPSLSLEERNEMVVKLQVERLKSSPDAAQKLHHKEQNIRREITQLQNDIQTLRTNIEFFARSKNADKLREEYEGRIADAQHRIEQLNRQLKAFRG